MVSLSAEKRAAYASAQPRFWRPAENADVRQAAWFGHLMGEPRCVTLVARDPQGDMQGFVIGTIGAAPPVYDPGGLTCAVDDFCVRTDERWMDVGIHLLGELRRIARSRGAVQFVVVCGSHDAPKHAALAADGLAPASTWFTGPIDDEDQTVPPTSA